MKTKFFFGAFAVFVLVCLFFFFFSGVVRANERQQGDMKPNVTRAAAYYDGGATDYDYQVQYRDYSAYAMRNMRWDRNDYRAEYRAPMTAVRMHAADYGAGYEMGYYMGYYTAAYDMGKEMNSGYTRVGEYDYAACYPAGKMWAMERTNMEWMS